MLERENQGTFVIFFPGQIQMLLFTDPPEQCWSQGNFMLSKAFALQSV